MALAADALMDVTAPPPARRAPPTARNDEDAGQFADLLPRTRHQDDPSTRPPEKSDTKSSDTEHANAAAQEDEAPLDETQAAKPNAQPGEQPHHQPHFMLQLLAAQAQQAIAQTQQAGRANTAEPQQGANAATPVQPQAPNAMTAAKPTRPTKQSAKSAASAQTPGAKSASAQTQTPAQQTQPAQTAAAQPQAQTQAPPTPVAAPETLAPPQAAPAAAAPDQSAPKQTSAIDAVSPAQGDAKARPMRAEAKAAAPQTPTTPNERASTPTPTDSAPAAAKEAVKSAAAPAAQPQAAQTPPAPTAPASAIADARSAAGDAAQQTARAAPVASQVGHEIVKRFNGETTRFQMRLDPPELGRIEVRLDVSRDHRVTAVISADNPQALSDLSRATRDLQQALQSAGLELADNGLSFDLHDQSGGFSANEERNAQRNAAPAHTTITTEEPQTASRPVRLESWRGARVDLVA